MSAVGHYGLVCHSGPQTAALPRLGGIEGVEHAGTGIRIHPMARVTRPKPHLAGRGAFAVVGAGGVAGPKGTGLAEKFPPWGMDSMAFWQRFQQTEPSWAWFPSRSGIGRPRSTRTSMPSGTPSLFWSKSASTVCFRFNEAR